MDGHGMVEAAQRMRGAYGKPLRAVEGVQRGLLPGGCAEPPGVSA
jgi:hypothetical protein